jgi:hypothetical protein
MLVDIVPDKILTNLTLRPAKHFCHDRPSGKSRSKPKKLAILRRRFALCDK